MTEEMNAFDAFLAGLDILFHISSVLFLLPLILTILISCNDRMKTILQQMWKHLNCFQ